jgi:radical SAM superfamily enzyme YgiQ (UPF0313 family)
MGIESPSAESLKETRKIQNLKGSLVGRLKEIQKAGLLTYGSFIVGFDSDTGDIFDRQIEFITDAAIPNAMIGPLVALPGTPLFTRMKQSGRLIEDMTGDEERTLGSGYTNIVTCIPRRQLLEGHLRVIRTLYEPEAYFSRAIEMFSRMGHPEALSERMRRLFFLLASGVRNLVSKWMSGQLTLATMRSQYRQQRAIIDSFPEHYKKASQAFTRRVMREHPDQIPFIMHYITLGYHYYMFTFDHAVPGLTKLLAEEDLLEDTRRATQEASAA